MSIRLAPSADSKQLNEAEIVALFEEAGVFRRNGHFVTAAGRHAGERLKMCRVWAAADTSEALTRELALRWLDTADAPVPNVIAGPAVGGGKLAELLATTFNRMAPGRTEPVRWLAVGKNGAGGFLLAPEAASVLPGRSVLMTGSLVNTGESLSHAAYEVQRHGGTIIGMAALWSCGGLREVRVETERRVPRRTGEPVPLLALVHRTLVGYEAGSCPYCRVRMAMTEEAACAVR